MVGIVTHAPGGSVTSQGRALGRPFTTVRRLMSTPWTCARAIEHGARGESIILTPGRQSSNDAERLML